MGKVVKSCRIKTPRFASPNSRLPQEELDRLQECIHASNEILRTLGNPTNEPNLRALQLSLSELIGLMVRVTIACGEQKPSIIGKLEQAGRDFIQLNLLGQRIFILFERILTIRREACAQGGNGAQISHRVQELLGLNKCERQTLTLDFGNVVSGDPFLLNLFFGIPLHLFLTTLLFHDVVVRVEGNEEISGVLVEVTEGSIQLQIEPQEGEGYTIRQINFNHICFIQFNQG